MINRSVLVNDFLLLNSKKILLKPIKINTAYKISPNAKGKSEEIHLRLTDKMGYKPFE